MTRFIGRRRREQRLRARRLCRGQRRSRSPEADGFAPILLRLGDDELPGQRGLAGRFEDESVLARIDGERAPFQPLGENLAVHGHLDGAQVGARAVLGLEDDGRDRGIDLVDPVSAFLADVRWTIRGGADEDLGTFGAKLVIVAGLERGLAGCQAIGGGRIGGLRERRQQQASGEEGIAQSGDAAFHRHPHRDGFEKHSGLKCFRPWSSKV